MRKLVLFFTLVHSLVAAGKLEPWLGSWQFVSVNPVEDPAHTLRDCVAAFTEHNGKVRRVGKGHYGSGEAYLHDTGWVAWDGVPHQTTGPGTVSMLLQAELLDDSHLDLTAKFKDGTSAVFHCSLLNGGRRYRQEEDVVLPDGRKQHITEIWEKLTVAP